MSKRPIHSYFARAPTRDVRHKSADENTQPVPGESLDGRQQRPIAAAPWDNLMSHVQHADKEAQQQTAGTPPDGTLTSTQPSKQAVVSYPNPGTDASGLDSKQQQGAPVSNRSQGPSAAELAGGAAADGVPCGSSTSAQKATSVLMAAAKAQAKQEKQQAGIRQLTPQEMREVAQRNYIAVSAALSSSAAEGHPLQLQQLLVEPSWKDVVGGEFSKPCMAKLQQFLNKEWASGTVYPPKEHIFRALNSVPFDQVRVVILGQDPYHGAGQAMGLSFSVPQGVRLPSSLQNMYKELEEDCGIPKSKNGDLSKWCEQGVLLLNASLSVRASQANSHANQGWEAFTGAVVSALSAKRSGVVFLLWGKFAQTRGAGVDKKQHHVLMAPHPSGLSAHRGFIGCKHFSKANELLTRSGQRCIDWKIE